MKHFFARRFRCACALVAFSLTFLVATAMAEDSSIVTKATIDGTGPGWKSLGESDFVNVNTDPDTWTWKDDGVHCKGTPVGVTRSQKKYTNFELVATWKHLKSGGNSGIFVWASENAAPQTQPGAPRRMQ